MDIILLTIGYPYPNKDVFIANELSILSKKFNKVWIIPVFEGTLFPKKKYYGEIQNLPNNVYVQKIKYNISNIFDFNKCKLKLLVRELSFSLKNNIKLLRWVFHANIIYHNIYHLIKTQNIVPEDTIVYSFWFHFNALAMSYLNNNIALKVSRAHGYDLYNEITVQPFKNYILENIDAVFACSKMGKDYLIKRYNCKKCYVSYLGTINNNVQINKFSQGNDFIIISCARVERIKRIHRIVDALSLIEKYPVVWIHIGDGSLLNEIKEYAALKLKGKANIKYKFMGALSNNEVLEYYRNNRINLFINVSSSEGLPVSIMEATSFGIPIIATDVGGVNEIVEDNVNGFLLEKDYKDSQLAELINKFISMPHVEYERFCRASLEKWMNNFNAVKNYESFFNTLIRMATEKGENNKHVESNC